MLVLYRDELKGKSRQWLELHTAVRNTLFEKNNPAASFTHHPTFLQLSKKLDVLLCLLSTYTVQPLCFRGLLCFHRWEKNYASNNIELVNIRSPICLTFHTWLCWRIIFLTTLWIRLLSFWFCLIQGTLPTVQTLFHNHISKATKKY